MRIRKKEREREEGRKKEKKEGKEGRRKSRKGGGKEKLQRIPQVQFSCSVTSDSLRLHEL